MSNGMSDKERALVEAARRDLEKMRALPGSAQAVSPSTTPMPAPAPAPAPAISINAPQVSAAPAKRPDVPKPEPEIARGGTSPDAIAMRIAVLMEAEREEKARRLKSHRRWKIGAIGAFVVLSGWWALTIINHLRH